MSCYAHLSTSGCAALSNYMWSALTRDLWRGRGWVRWFVDNGLAPSGSCRQGDKQTGRKEGEQWRFLLHDLIHTHLTGIGNIP